MYLDCGDTTVKQPADKELRNKEAHVRKKQFNNQKILKVLQYPDGSSCL